MQQNAVFGVVTQTYVATDATQVSADAGKSLDVRGDYGDGWCQVVDVETQKQGIFPTAYLSFPNGPAPIIDEDNGPVIVEASPIPQKNLLQQNLTQINQDTESMWENFDSISVRQSHKSPEITSIPNFSDMHNNFNNVDTEVKRDNHLELELQRAKAEIKALKSQINDYERMESHIKTEMKKKLGQYIVPLVSKLRALEAENTAVKHENNTLKLQRQNLRSYTSTVSTRSLRPAAPSAPSQPHQPPNTYNKLSDPFAELGF